MTYKFTKILSIVLLITQLNADRLRILNSEDDSQVIEKLGIAGLKNTLKLADKKDAGTWYLQRARWEEYTKVKNDEFSYDDAVNQSYSMLLDEVNKSQSILNQTFYVDTFAYFGDYNFEKSRFQLPYQNEFFFTNYIQKFVEQDRALSIKFNNFQTDKLYLEMDKTNAKTFLEKRKNEKGEIDRSLIVRYIFNIKSIETPVKYPMNGCYKRMCRLITFPKTVVELKEIYIMDRNNNILSDYKIDKQKSIEQHEILGKYNGKIDKAKAETTFYLENNQLLGKYYVYEDPDSLGKLYNAKINGNSITFNWKDKYGMGKVAFYFNSSLEQFKGTWGQNNSSSGGGNWNGQRN